nr:MAG TPA: hypothetical protein [Caudoviricetes sp.]
MGKTHLYSRAALQVRKHPHVRGEDRYRKSCRAG